MLLLNFRVVRRNKVTLLQLQYVLAVEEYKSINAAAKNLYVAQSSISGAIRELEKELGITIYFRNNRGISITREGEEFIRYAKNVILQFDLLRDHYDQKKNIEKKTFRVTFQHSNVAAREFADIINQYGFEKYEYSIIEGSTNKVIHDVKESRSEFGFIQLNLNNKEMIEKYLVKEALELHVLGERPAYVYMSPKHPLAHNEIVTYENLEKYPYLIYEQDDNSSTYFYEDIIDNIGFTNVIRTYDRGTMLDLVNRINAFTIGIGIVEKKSKDLIAVRLDSNETFIVAYITRKGALLSELGNLFLEKLKTYL